MKGRWVLGLCTGLLLRAPAPALHAQAPGVPVERSAPLLRDPALVARVRALHQAGKLLDRRAVVALLKSPRPVPLSLPEPGAQVLAPRAVAERARKAYVRVGWYDLCPDCGQWHFNFAGGYAITREGVVATCYHCVAPDEGSRQGFLVALDPSGALLPVTSVLAADPRLDAAILRVAGGRFEPLPLNDQVAPGDAAYLLSDPLDTLGYFSAGVVNRFYRLRDPGGDPTTLAGARSLRLNVSTDWAPGSSGAAVLDACGNAIGHVATITPLFCDMTDDGSPTRPRPQRRAKKQAAEPSQSTPLLLLHEAVPARGVLLLVRAMDGSGGWGGAVGRGPAR